MYGVKQIVEIYDPVPSSLAPPWYGPPVVRFPPMVWSPLARVRTWNIYETKYGEIAEMENPDIITTE